MVADHPAKWQKAVVAGIIGQFLCAIDVVGHVDNNCLIYTEVIAGLSVLLSVTVLVFPPKKPNTTTFYWITVADFAMCLAWITAFAWMVNLISPVHCGALRYLDELTRGDTCELWKVAVAFAFASSMAWFANGVTVGIFMGRLIRLDIDHQKGRPFRFPPTVGSLLVMFL